MAQHFYIAVWSSAQRENVDSMVDKAFRKNQSLLLERWNRSYCELKGGFAQNCDTFKDLRKLWGNINNRYATSLGFRFGESNTVIIDDSPTKIKYQPANQIMIGEYDSINPEDVELQQLKAYFETLLQNFPKDPHAFDVRDFLHQTKFISTKKPPIVEDMPDGFQ